MALILQVGLWRLLILIFSQGNEAIFVNKYSHGLYSMEESIYFNDKLSILYQEWVFEIKTNLSRSPIRLIKPVKISCQETFLFVWYLFCLNVKILNKECLSIQFKFFKFIEIIRQYPDLRYKIVVIRELFLDFQKSRDQLVELILPRAWKLVDHLTLFQAFEDWG